MNKKDSIPILIESIPDWDFVSEEHEAIEDAAKCFNLLNAPEAIKEILTNDLTEGMPDVEARCLDLLKERHSNFVKEWKDKKETTNIESEESDESKPTT